MTTTEPITLLRVHVHRVIMNNEQEVLILERGSVILEKYVGAGGPLSVSMTCSTSPYYD